MKFLDGILEMVDKELGNIEQNGKFRSRDEVHSVYELIDIAKDIYCIWQYEDEEGFSEERGNNENYYGGNYARGRGRNARRDRMGRYSSERRGNNYENYDNSNYERGGSSYERGGSNYERGGSGYRGNNYRRGYSRDDAKKEFAENLKEMMEQAPDNETRQKIQRMIQNMESE